MNIGGKQRFKLELEKFISTRLRPVSGISSVERGTDPKKGWNDREERSAIMQRAWREERHGERIGHQQPNNHELCHEMFWNAYSGRSLMFIQMEELSRGKIKFEKEEKVTLYFSLATLQMFDYDIMMFDIMENSEDEAYADAAKKYYCPYIFGYVAEVDREKYRQLCLLQEEVYGSGTEAEESGSYRWFLCMLDQGDNKEQVYLQLDGYVVEAASHITKRKHILNIIETPGKTLKELRKELDCYQMRRCCLKSDNAIIDTIKKHIPSGPLHRMDIYRIGNGNCVCAAENDPKKCFFYDVGYNCRHKPKKITSGASYNYVDAMRAISSRSPAMVVLSHWDMDHIAGSVAIGKSIFEKPWIAPDCYDAVQTACRIAKYLDLRDQLYLVDRRSGPKGKAVARRIGSINEISHEYLFYMGDKASCDASIANCEGIMIEYRDKMNDRVVLMLGDVNYTSFDNARSNAGEKLFAETKIDDVIVPHHGSKHTDYIKITGPGKPLVKGDKAVICCVDDVGEDRPNKEHKKELEKRFEVLTTESDASPDKVSVKIIL